MNRHYPFKLKMYLGLKLPFSFPHYLLGMGIHLFLHKLHAFRILIDVTSTLGSTLTRHDRLDTSFTVLLLGFIIILRVYRDR